MRKEKKERERKKGKNIHIQTVAVFLNKECFSTKKEKRKTTLIIIRRIQFNYFGLVDGGEFRRGIGNNGGNVRANNFENGC